MKKRREMKPFWKFYAIFASSLVLIVVVGLALLYGFIKEYELTRPERIIDEYLDGVGDGELEAAIGEIIDKYASGFENDGAAGALIAEEIGKNGFVYAKSADGDDVYDIFCGGRIMSVSLCECGGGRFGMRRYEVADVRFYGEWVTSRARTLTAIVPESMMICCNGKAVAEKYIDGDPFSSGTASELEPELVSDGIYVTYTIKNVIGDAFISASSGGAELTSPSEDVYVFMPDIGDIVCVISAPERASVTVNGIEVGKKYIESTEVVSDASPYEAGSAPKTVTYMIDKLHSEPEVTAELDGTALPMSETNGIHVFSYPESMRASYTVKAPAGVKVYCNGIGITEAPASSGKYQIPDGAGVKSAEREAYDEYVIRGLYGIPEFTSDGGCVREITGNETVFYQTPSSSEEKILKSAALDFTERFMKYSYEGTDYTRANYASVMELVMADSEAYALIEKSLSSMIYNSNFKVDRLDTELYDLIRYADGVYGIRVDFDSHGMYYKYEKVSAGTYTMIWTDAGDGLLLSYLSFN